MFKKKYQKLALLLTTVVFMQQVSYAEVMVWRSYANPRFNYAVKYQIGRAHV